VTEAEHKAHEEETERKIRENIEKFGCHIVLIEPDNYLPGFAYSIGLYKNYGHPEIICFGLSKELLGSLINTAQDLIKEGQKLTTDTLYSDFLEDFDVQFLKVDKEHLPDYMGYARWFYQSCDFPVLQLVWPDKESRFPWVEGFNTDWKFKQPLLDRNTDFKFYEERNLGVFTTKQVLEGAPILYVYHNEDGDWQFHSSSEPDINDSKLVCLEEIVELDPTINKIHYLQYGWRAWRESTEDEWETEEDTEEE
jgi:hypothetical protein